MTINKTKKGRKISLMSKSLKEIQIAQELSDIYRDHLDAETLRGRILDVSSEIIHLEKFSDEGEYDGRSFIQLADVTRVRSKGRELELVKNLSANTSRKRYTGDIAAENLWDAIELVQQNLGYVVLFIEDIDPDICIIGELVEHDENHVRLNEFGTLKTQDRRELVVEKSAITRVDYDGGYEVTISNIGGSI